MLKILFVDDDVIARQNMEKRINWKEYGWELVYVARDGVEALDYMKNNQPDIVISDIKMPIMDGIEMARIAKDFYPDLFFIFLSGYKEFEYARQALALKAIDYLDKPIENDKLIEVIKKAEEQYFQYRETQQIVSEKYPLVKRHYISQLMFNNFKEADDTIFKTFDINLSSGLGIVGFMEVDNEKICSEDNGEKTFQELCNILTQKYHGSLFLDMGGYQMFFIYTEAKCDEENCFLENVKKTEQYINDYLKKKFGIAGTFYYGSIMKNISDLYHSYQRALQEKNSETYMLLLDVKKYIDEHFNNPDLSLTQVGQEFNINHCYLTRLFKDQFGVNLYDYLIQVRMENAGKYLKTTDLKSYEIAEKVGYKNSQYFSLSFKKHYGCTVKEYKNKPAL